MKLLTKLNGTNGLTIKNLTKFTKQGYFPNNKEKQKIFLEKIYSQIVDYNWVLLIRKEKN